MFGIEAFWVWNWCVCVCVCTCVCACACVCMCVCVCVCVAWIQTRSSSSTSSHLWSCERVFFKSACEWKWCYSTNIFTFKKRKKKKRSSLCVVYFRKCFSCMLFFNVVFFLSCMICVARSGYLYWRPLWKKNLFFLSNKQNTLKKKNLDFGFNWYTNTSR